MSDKKKISKKDKNRYLRRDKNGLETNIQRHFGGLEADDSDPVDNRFEIGLKSISMKDEPINQDESTLLSSSSSILDFESVTGSQSKLSVDAKDPHISTEIKIGVHPDQPSPAPLTLAMIKKSDAAEPPRTSVINPPATSRSVSREIDYQLDNHTFPFPWFILSILALIVALLLFRFF